GRMAIAVSALRKSKAKPLIASLAFCAVSATAAIAMDRGQFSKVPREAREWFEHIRSPKGLLCCSYADGHRTYPIPPEVVIMTANPFGEAVVWYVRAGDDDEVMTSGEVMSSGPKYRILCFVPADGA